MTRFDILYVITSLAIGGAERHVSALASRLARQGHKITIYCVYGKGPFAAEAERCGVRVLGPPHGANAGSQSRMRLAAGRASSILRLYGLMLFRRPRIAHFFGPPAYLMGSTAALGAGLGRLVMSRRCLNDYQAKRPHLAKLEQWMHRRMSAILGNSQAVVSQLREDENVPKKKLGLIYNGVDLTNFDTPIDRDGLRASINTGADDLVIAILANLIPYKGHADLLGALARIKTQLPRNWKLWIIGRDDGIGPQLRRQGADLGLTEHLAFLGLRHDVPSLLRSADIAVSSSHEEGFSNAVLEAMAASLPVVATDAGGNSEAVDDGVSGFVVPVGALDAIGSALLKLAGDPRVAARMGRAGRARVETRFSMDVCVAEYAALYEAIMAGRPVAGVAGVGAMQSSDAGENRGAN